jgi:DNA polymerase III alpha subunit (gram-positive type)
VKYLFFDIECANPKFNSICTFGYVTTDEYFNVTEQRDILINPETGYDKYVVKNILHYPVELLNAQMPFPCFYDELRELMSAEDTVVFGFSISNDIRFLNETCIRYRLPALNYTFYDVQKLFGEFANVTDQASIEKAYEVLGLGKPDIVHRSDEDARATMEILKALVNHSAETSIEYLAKKINCSGTNRNFIEKWNIEGKNSINHKKNHYKTLMLRAQKRKEAQLKKEAEKKAETLVPIET